METEFQPMLPVEVSNEATTAPTVEQVQTKIMRAVTALAIWVLSCQTLTFFEFETQLVPQILEVGRLFVQLFLCQREEQYRMTHPRVEAGYQRQCPVVRQRCV